MIYMSTHENIRNDIYVNTWKYKKCRGSYNMQCCCYSEVQKAESQETMSMRQDSSADGSQENNGCMLDSRSTARISVREWARRVSQIPQWVTKLTVSTEWDLLVRAMKILRCRWRWQPKCYDVDDDCYKDVRRHWRCVSEHFLEQWSGPRQGRAIVLLVDTSKAVQEQQRSTGYGASKRERAWSASGVWCLLEGTVTAGQVDLRSATGASWCARWQ